MRNYLRNYLRKYLSYLSFFKEMKDKMINVLVNLENIREGPDDVAIKMMIEEMKEALKLATGKVHGSNETKILEIPYLKDK